MRIDPVSGGAPARLLRVKPIPSRRDEQSEEREERREQEEAGASYAPAPEPVVDAYGPRVPGAVAPASPPGGEATPAWVAALLRAR